MPMKSRTRFLQIALLLVPLSVMGQEGQTNQSTDERRSEERLTFQTGQPWTPRTNLNADVAMVYGIGYQMVSNLQTWRQHGYVADVMTGVAWGSYQDYLEGQFDGQKHWDQAQTDVNGNPILHAGDRSIPYISPGDSYGRYLSQGIRRALDAGAGSIYLEEPEFWANSGWEENFKREWKAYYGEDWQAPNSSPDAQYRTSKLKYFLYRRALQQIFEYVREYGKANGRVIPCYVATHSLINYANWRIVSPESSLLKVGADGYIAQIWTGTARTPNYYNGIRKERTFETAFLEYGSMQNLARASGRRIWYLNDPIEDDPNHDWNDYRVNWESTLVASLLQANVWRYEIMPWPERVFNSKHPVKSVVAVKKSIKELEQAPVGTGLGGFGPEPDVEKAGIPKAYETELQSVIRALGDMKQSDVKWQEAGTQNVGILVSDTLMFERADPSPSDAALGSFYGLALPLVEHGIPVEPVQIETATEPVFLANYKMLLLTYEGQKPPSPEFHEALAAWVRRGGALVVIDDDGDPYNKVREWWNSAPNVYQTPRQHLFAQLSIPLDEAGLHRVGEGAVLFERISPAALTRQKDGGAVICRYARLAAAAINLKWLETNAIVMRRGPYVIATGLDEPIAGAKPTVVRGRFVDLFDANLRVVSNVALLPDSHKLLLDLDLQNGSGPKIVAASCHVAHERADAHKLAFDADGIAGTHAVARIRTAEKPVRISAGGVTLEARDYEMENGTLLIRFENAVDAQHIEISFAHRD
jgi:hypothetical protein